MGVGKYVGQIKAAGPALVEVTDTDPVEVDDIESMGAKGKSSKCDTLPEGGTSDPPSGSGA